MANDDQIHEEVQIGTRDPRTKPEQGRKKLKSRIGPTKS